VETNKECNHSAVQRRGLSSSTTSLQSIYMSTSTLMDEFNLDSLIKHDNLHHIGTKNDSQRASRVHTAEVNI